MNELVVTLVLILLPGIIAAVIADKITVHSRWGSFKFGLYAFLLGVGCYATLQLAFWAWCFMSHVLCSNCSEYGQLRIWSVALDDGVSIHGREVVLATILALPVAFLASWIVNFKLLNRLAQKLRITTKYGDENLYSHYLNSQEIDWIYVRDQESDLTYQGRVMSLSENESVNEVVLVDVTVFRYTDSKKLYEVPSLYISKPLGSFIIEAIPLNRMEVIDEQEKTTN